MAALALRMARGHLLGVSGSGEALLSRGSPALLRRMSDRVLSDEEKAAENVFFKVRACCLEANPQVAVKLMALMFPKETQLRKIWHQLQRSQQSAQGQCCQCSSFTGRRWEGNEGYSQCSCARTRHFQTRC